MCMLRATLVAVIFSGLSLAAAAPAQAQDWLEPLTQSLRAGEKQWESEPRLFPGNGSYFQLVRDNRRLGGHSVMFWDVAAQRAREKRFQERQGRLAKITSPDLYDWIRMEFDLRQMPGEGATWIGLRYWCKYRKLMWADGSVVETDGYGAWDTPWFREDGIRCSTTDIDFMGVYIKPDTNRWRATGEKKGYSYYLVEYPAPAGTTASSAAND